MANIEKHPKQTMKRIYQTDFDAVPTSRHESHPIGQDLENGDNTAAGHLPAAEDSATSFILRLEDLPASPDNLERVRERVRRLYRRLAESSAPFRVRVVQ